MAELGHRWHRQPGTAPAGSETASEDLFHERADQAIHLCVPECRSTVAVPIVPAAGAGAATRRAHPREERVRRALRERPDRRAVRRPSDAPSDAPTAGNEPIRRRAVSGAVSAPARAGRVPSTPASVHLERRPPQMPRGGDRRRMPRAGVMRRHWRTPRPARNALRTWPARAPPCRARAPRR